MIKKVSILLSVISLHLVLLSASTSVAAEYKFPTPDEYLVTESFQGKPAPVDLKSHPSANNFRTRLREGAKKGPNFAGKYTIVKWGCGSGCMSIGIIEAASGKVIFPDEISPIWFVGIPARSNKDIEYGLIYNKESSLLIIHGIPSKETKAGSYYYKFENNRFELIDSIEWESDFNKDHEKAQNESN